MRWEHLDEIAKCKVCGFEVRLDGGAGKRAGHAKLEVNFNAKDTKDHPNGVWTLPPNLRGCLDRENTWPSVTATALHPNLSIHKKSFKIKYLFISLCWLVISLPAIAAVPETVRFASRDGNTELVGYLFKPETEGPYPAIVMLHGRGGPYSSLKRGTYTAETLTMRHRMWGRFWAARGYLALHVDSFGPRGYHDGFPKHSYSQRPPEVNEQTVRPLDAYGALDYLRQRGDVVKDRIGLHGWSNGGMTLLAAMAPNPPRVAPHLADRVRLPQPEPATDFRAALAQYPGCRIQRDQADYKPYAPLLLLTASEDDEVSPHVCATLAQHIKARGGNVDFVMYQGAHHSYDDPGKTKQSHAPNRAALQDSLRRAEAFFATHLRP